MQGTRVNQQRYRRYGKAFNANPVTGWYGGFWLLSELLHASGFSPGKTFLTSLYGPTQFKEMQRAQVKGEGAVFSAGAHPPVMLVMSRLLTSPFSIFSRKGS